MGSKTGPYCRERTDEDGRSAFPSSFSLSTLTKLVFLVKEKINNSNFLPDKKFHPREQESLLIRFYYDIKISKKMQERNLGETGQEEI
jgi:hypothetical protein